MKNYIVLSDKVNHLRFRIFPVFLPVGSQLPGRGNIADGSIKPDIEYLAFCTFNRNGNSPVKVAAYGSWLKPLIDPRLALTVDIGLPFLVILKYPLAEPSFILVERKVPVKGFPHNRLTPADCGTGIDKIIRTE